MIFHQLWLNSLAADRTLQLAARVQVQAFGRGSTVPSQLGLGWMAGDRRAGAVAGELKS